MPKNLTRRQLLATATVAGGALLQTERAEAADTVSPWPLSLNASTIRPAPLEDKIRIAAQAGYDAIELWSNELERYEKEGGSLADVRKRLDDAGLVVPNIIGLGGCMPAEDGKRPAALETARRRLDVSARVGAACIAVPPSPDRPDIDLQWAAQRYSELLALGREFGVRVAVEFIGFFNGISRLAQAAAIAIDSNESDACVLPDVFHLFRGGSGFNAIRHLSGDFIAVFHVNDAPSAPPREEQQDQDRVHVGDGILPVPQLLRDLRAINYRGPLSLELFNRDYWEQDPLAVAQTGIAKMREAIASMDG